MLDIDIIVEIMWRFGRDVFPSPRSGRRAPRIPLKFMPLLLVRQIGNVTKDRLGPCQGSNERKVMGADMGSGRGVQRRRAVVCLPITAIINSALIYMHMHRGPCSPTSVAPNCSKTISKTTLYPKK